MAVPVSASYLVAVTLSSLRYRPSVYLLLCLNELTTPIRVRLGNMQRRQLSASQYELEQASSPTFKVKFL